MIGVRQSTDQAALDILIVLPNIYMIGTSGLMIGHFPDRDQPISKHQKADPSQVGFTHNYAFILFNAAPTFTVRPA